MTARAALYAAILTLVVGLAGGPFVLSLIQRWTAAASANVSPPADVRVDAPVATGENVALTIVDRSGKAIQEIAATRPWTPRFSPDGKKVAYGAFGAGRSTSDVWVMDLDSKKTRRLTDDDADANDPQWSPDGGTIAYSVSAEGGKDVALQPIAWGARRVLAERQGTQFPSDWIRDGSALLVTDETNSGKGDILVQPSDGSSPRPYVATSADETAARISPDGRWIAYTSDESGKAEVYLDSYPRPSRRIKVSSNGGIHPVWRGDKRELYYWRDGALVAVAVGAPSPDVAPVVGEETVLFRMRYLAGLNTMYDVTPDGQRFVVVRER